MRYIVVILLALFVFAANPSTVSAQQNTEFSSASNVFQGRLVKTEEQSAVYYIGLEGKRHAFPNAHIYFSWYADFSKVEVISDFEMALYPLGKNVLYRPGSRLVKIAEVPEVYAVEPGGELRNIPSEAAAIALYGQNWSKKVDDLDISFFFDYAIAGVVEVVDDRALYPRGTVINFDGSNFLVDRRTDGLFLFRPVTDAAWKANGFERLERQTVTDYSLREFFEIGLPVTTAEASFACPACSEVFFRRLSMAQSQVQRSANERYAITLPQDWQVTFPSSLNPESETVIMAVPKEGELPRSFSVMRRALAEGETLQAFIGSELESLDASEELYYSGPSLFLNNGNDLVYGRRDGNNNPEQTEYVWFRFVQYGDTVYRLQYTTPLTAADADSEAIEQLMRSVQVDIRIPE